MSASQKNPKKSIDQSGNNAISYEQQILNTSSIGVLITRMGEGTILYANKAIIDLLGIADVDSMIGMPVPNFYWDLEDRKAILERFRAEGSITNSELRARRADGSMIWVSLSIQPFNFKGEQVLLSEIADINARKQMEEALHASEEQFRSLYDNATIGLYRTTPEGQILMINPTGLRLLGFDSFEELAKRNLEEAGFEEVDARKKFRERLEREGGVEQESVWTKKDGTPIFVRESSTISRDENGNVLYYDGSFEDISDRKQAEEALRASEQRYQTIFNSSPVMFWLKDTKNNMIQINKAAAAFENVKPEGVQGRSAYEVYPREQAEAFYQDDLTVIRSGTPKLGIVEKHTSPGTGVSTWLETGKVPILDDKGEVSGILAFGVDITDRQQAEAAVRESEERFRRFTEATVEGLVFHEQGKIIDANPAGLAMFGLTDNADFIGRNLMEFVVPESHKMVLEQMQLETVLPYEIQCVRKDGFTFPVETSTRTYKEGGRIIRASSIRDITERKQADQVLRESQQLLQLVMDNIPQAVFWKDQELTYMGANQSFAEDAGLASPQELIGKKDFDMPWKEQAELFRADDQRVLESGEVKLNYEEPQTNATGKVTWLRTSKIPMRDSNGQIFAVLGMYEDVTERKQAEEETRRLQNAMEQTGDGIALADLSGNVLYANPAWAEMHGYTVDEVLGKHLSIFHTQEQLEKEVIPFNDQAMATGENTSEIGHARKDGTTFPTLMTVAVQKDENGAPVGLIGTIRDITERKQAEEELRRTQMIVETTSDFIGMAAPDGKGSYINPAGLAMTGYTAEEFYGGMGIGSFQPTLPPEVMETVMNKGTWQGESEFFRKDGTSFPVSQIITISKDKEGQTQGLITISRDITDRRQAEEELQQEKIFSDAVINGSAGTFFLFDTQGNMIRWNEEYEKVLGYTAEETRARNAVDPIADEDKENTAAAIGRGFTEGQTSVEANFVTKNGERIPYYFVARRFQIGNQMYLAGTGIDITERKQLEAEVQKAFERRGYQVQISTEISQEVAAATELSELFGRVVTLTKERLGYYHAQLLRYDNSLDAVVLINGYGETGNKMLADGHQMPMGSGLIGTAAATGETILRPNLTDDPDWHPNPLLPDTQGEIAVPIKLGDQILGVLDVQSNKAGALTEDDRLLLEGLCGQVAVAIEQTRLRQEMTERLEEVNRLYRSMSHEGWKTYRETENLPTGFMFDQAGLQPVDKQVLTEELFTNIPMRVLGGETVGTLTVANDPQHPTSPEDYLFLQQVSDQVALALEGARLSAQTQSALAQSERLFEASRVLTQATDLQELVKAVAKNLNIPEVNRLALQAFSYNSAGDVEGMTLVANWWNNTGTAPEPVGSRYSTDMLGMLPSLNSATPLFFNDLYNDERVDTITSQFMQSQNIRSSAILPLFLGEQRVGVLMLLAEKPHHFTEDEIRLASALAPQIATVLENRRQFERAQQQADRESTLNVISQKIQSATTVEAVLQIAARELGHALGAPMTIAQLSMKDKK